MIHKYRAWDKRCNEMVTTGHFLEFDGSVWYNDFTEDGHDRLYDQGDNLIVMAFTGLTDSKGADIYEGDILEFDRDEWYSTAINTGFTGLPENGPRESITIENLIRGDYFGGLSDFAEHKTVIGNIYEHSHLIGE